MKKVFGMATIPSRQKNLQQVLDTIIPNVDYGYLILNNYTEIPKFLNNKEYKKVVILRSQDISDFKDGAKLYPMIYLEEEVYYFSCDDDILYPKNYFDYMARRSAEKPAIISQYGYKFRENTPIVTDFISSITDKETWYLIKREQDLRVPFVGTGVMCINTKYYTIKSKEAFMQQYIPDVGADIWLAISCYKKGIPLYCIKSDIRGCLLKKLVYEKTIHRYLFKNPNDRHVREINKFIVRLINKVFFKV